MLYEYETNQTSPNEPPMPISPSIPRHRGGYDDRHDEGEDEIVSVLPFDNRIRSQVADICGTWLTPGLEDHPSDVRVKEAFTGVVGIKVGVGVSMVGAVSPSPPRNGTFDDASTENSMYSKILVAL